MFRSLVRLLVPGGEGGESCETSTRRFTPRLEALDGRTMPSTLSIGAAVPNESAWVGQVGQVGGAAGGVVGSVDPCYRATGEEIPQT